MLTCDHPKPNLPLWLLNDPELKFICKACVERDLHVKKYRIVPIEELDESSKLKQLVLNAKKPKKTKKSN